MIRNRHGLGLIGVDCRQRDVLCDGNLIARVDELAVFRFPSAEVFGILRRKYAGGAAVYILLVIRFYIRTLNVCDREAILCGGEERGNRNGAVKFGIYIEQRAVEINPSGGLFLLELFKQFLKLFGIRKLCAVRNFDRFKISVRRGRQVNLSFNNRRLPLCVERNALCRHRLAGEHERVAFAKLVIIPACKCVTRIYFTRVIWNIVCVSNTGFILKVLSIIRTAVVNKCEVIRFAGVVEFSVVVFRFIFPIKAVKNLFVIRFEFLEFKPSYRILIFIRNMVTCTGIYIRMMKFILNSIIGCRSALTGKNLHIIICSLTTIIGIRSIELGAA